MPFEGGMEMYRKQSIEKAETLLIRAAIGIVVAVFIAGIGASLGYQSRDQEVANLKQSYQKLESTFRRSVPRWYTTGGYDARRGITYRFQIFSLDEGKNWYAATFEENGGLLICGLAEECYPGILSEMQRVNEPGQFPEESDETTT